jgi:hypothetical protein
VTRRHHIGTNVRGEPIVQVGRSKRSFQMEMAKWDKVYDRELRAKNAVHVPGQGVREGDFARERAHEEKMRAAYREMERVHQEAKDAGHWVSIGWHKYHHSTYAKLVSENRD